MHESSRSGMYNETHKQRPETQDLRTMVKDLKDKVGMIGWNRRMDVSRRLAIVDRGCSSIVIEAILVIGVTYLAFLLRMCAGGLGGY
jgi:tetrahydromethanopterin S-methyltransferase subunit F